MEKLLLVEDDATLVRTLSSFLEAEGFSVAAVSGQTAAIGRMSSASFDLALVDISLAEGNGFAVCTEARG